MEIFFRGEGCKNFLAKKGGGKTLRSCLPNLTIPSSPLPPPPPPTKKKNQKKINNYVLNIFQLHDAIDKTIVVMFSWGYCFHSLYTIFRRWGSFLQK